jgi:cell division protein FtsL
MKLNLILLVALLLSALLLVKTTFESRQLFAAIDSARAEQAQLDAEYKRLDAEAREQSTNTRVERVARDQLGMTRAQQGVMTYVFDPAASTAAVPAASTVAASGRLK